MTPPDPKDEDAAEAPAKPVDAEGQEEAAKDHEEGGYA